MDEASRCLLDATMKYLVLIGICEERTEKYSAQVARYLLQVHRHLPMRTVIVGERPYFADIHPRVSSAMSYDPALSGPTPSTIGVSVDLSNITGHDRGEVERWFRDSWKYLSSGVLVVNCTVFRRFTSPDSLRDILPFQRWLQCVIDCSAMSGASKVDLVGMGVPAQSCANAVMRSMGVDRRYVRYVRYPNPAIISKKSVGDRGSLGVTFGFPATSRVILAAVKRSKRYSPLSSEDFEPRAAMPTTEYDEKTRDVVDMSASLVDEMEKAFSLEPAVAHMPTVREARDAFARALLSYRDTVIRDIVISSVERSAPPQSKLGKSTEWGSKKQWHKAPTSAGGSSKMTPVLDPRESERQRFVEDDSEAEHAPPVPETPQVVHPPVSPSQFSDDVRVSNAPAEAKRKTKRVVRRVKRVPAPSTGVAAPSAPKGSQLPEGGADSLQHVKYYLSQNPPIAAPHVEGDIDSTLSTGVVASELVSIVLDACAKDLEDSGVTASASLGLQDGKIVEGSNLLAVMRRTIGSA